jgi:hypothetical protein
MPSRSPAGWQRVFADNFSSAVPFGAFPQAVAAQWGTYRDGLKDSSKHGTYMPSQVISIRGGVMDMYLHSAHGAHLVGAALPVIAGAHGRDAGLVYGRYVVRLRSDAVRGYKLSVLLWPDSGVWPRDGEIDFPEADLGRPIHAFVHYQRGVSKNDQAGFTTRTMLTRWHTAAITWLPSGITFQLDGRVVARVRKRIPNTPMHLIFQAETQIGTARPANSSAGNVQIDWVTIDTPACNPTMSISPRVAACRR